MYTHCANATHSPFNCASVFSLSEVAGVESINSQLKKKEEEEEEEGESAAQKLLEALKNDYVGLENIEDAQALHYYNILRAMQATKAEVKQYCCVVVVI